MLEKIIEEIEHLPKETPEKAAMKIAIVGKRNAGKSTFVNSIVGEERVIASEVPGTTRDAVDVRFERDGQKFLVIDTAGVRKKRKNTGGMPICGAMAPSHTQVLAWDLNALSSLLPAWATSAT